MTAIKISIEKFKSLTETNTIKGRLHRSLIPPPIPKIDNCREAKIPNSKPNTKKNNEKSKHFFNYPS